MLRSGIQAGQTVDLHQLPDVDLWRVARRVCAFGAPSHRLELVPDTAFRTRAHKAALLGGNFSPVTPSESGGPATAGRADHGQPVGECLPQHRQWEHLVAQGRQDQEPRGPHCLLHAVLRLSAKETDAGVGGLSPQGLGTVTCVSG